MNMKIVCLGWGSLIWNSRELGILKEKWNKDGPVLPIEFTRISSDGRVTLVIDKGAPLQKVLWAELETTNLDEAVCLLAKREGTKCKNIHIATCDDPNSEGVNLTVVNWLKSKEIKNAIWTGLPPSSLEKSTIEYILEHLNGLSGCDRDRAEEYVRKAPAQIDTAYRRKIIEKFGWVSL